MKAEALTEEELLWERKGLGDEDPRVLNTLSTCLKFVKNPTSGATEYVEWTEGIKRPNKVDNTNLGGWWHRKHSQLTVQSVLLPFLRK